MSEKWVQIASVPLPESMADLSDEELEEVRVFVENRCVDEFLRLIENE